MYSIEEFDKAKTKILKYILYQKRTKQEISKKFKNIMDEDMFLDIMEYLEEAKYIDDINYIERKVEEYIILKNLSIKEIEYKLIAKGITRNDIEDYKYKNEDKLTEYEIKSAKNIIYKKSNSLDENEIKQYLFKKGYKGDNIKKALEK